MRNIYIAYIRICIIKNTSLLRSCTYSTLNVSTQTPHLDVPPLAQQPTHSSRKTHVRSKEALRKDREKESTSGLSREGRRSCCVCQRERKAVNDKTNGRS